MLTVRIQAMLELILVEITQLLLVGPFQFFDVDDLLLNFGVDANYNRTQDTSW